MDRWNRFEKQFPFYQIDVNGFFFLLHRAMKDTYKDDEFKKLRDIKVVSLEAMRKSFGSNPTWESALADDAKFLKFIKETCKGEADDVEADLLFNV